MPASGGTATAEFRGAVHNLAPAMDLRMEPSMHGSSWSGLIHMDDNEALCLAHGQKVTLPTLASSHEDQKVMLYNWKISWAWGQAQLISDVDSHMVVLPDNDAITIWKVAEVCSAKCEQ